MWSSPGSDEMHYLASYLLSFSCLPGEVNTMVSDALMESTLGLGWLWASGVKSHALDWTPECSFCQVLIWKDKIDCSFCQVLIWKDKITFNAISLHVYEMTIYSTQVIWHKYGNYYQPLRYLAYITNSTVAADVLMVDEGYGMWRIFNLLVAMVGLGAGSCTFPHAYLNLNRPINKVNRCFTNLASCHSTESTVNVKNKNGLSIICIIT